MTQSDLTLLFADIVGSSRLYTQLGNQKAEAVVNVALQTAASLSRREGGEVIKTIGDAILCCFTAPTQAAAAALALQRDFAGSSNVAWRIGFHHGAAVRREGDVFGDAVNVASRICALAKARQILTTEPTAALFASTDGLATRPLERLELKGRPGTIGLEELLSDTANLTAVADRSGTTSAVALRADKDVLLLSRGGDQRVLTRNGGTIMIGRDARCDFIVEHDKTSRTHLKIESRRNGFIATDQSTNGTLIFMSGREVHLRRDSLPLLGEGWISPAGRERLSEEQRVRFTVNRDSTQVVQVQPAAATPARAP